MSDDKASAQTMLAEILRTVERQKAGLIDKAADQLEELVQTSIDDFQEHLESRSRSESHVSETIRMVRKLVNETGCVALRDLQRAENSIEKNLATQGKAGKSIRTINAHLTAIRSFCRWLVQKKRLSADPTTLFEELDEDVDRRHERRPLTDGEATAIQEDAGKQTSTSWTFRRRSGNALYAGSTLWPSAKGVVYAYAKIIQLQ